MKKNKKSTDSILKSIFDPIDQTQAQDSAPFLNAEETKTPKNRLDWTAREPRKPLAMEQPIISMEIKNPESLLSEAIEKVSKLAPNENSVEPETEALESIQNTPEYLEIMRSLENIQTFKPGLTHPTPIYPRAVEAVAILETEPSKDQWFEVISVAAIFIGLLAILVAFVLMDRIWHNQNSNISKNHFVATPVQAVSANPVLVKVDLLNHKDILFKSYSVKKTKLMLRAYAPSQAAILNFLNAMNGSEYFKNAQISMIQEMKSGAGKKSYEFQMYADIRP